ncbi:bifunctional GNAT family N-acetyltransferase/carbon-nitrogen hydrolase family protein [Ornithobacterium rhinotracheale]|uniref:bifunctional GNAT family N-acetyltransferase/carbon-nitrogen hydrolase family protein n=1 Tax=Ornithobacterium rhinotracheale TaxID=28251 RepID=UPI0040366932
MKNDNIVENIELHYLTVEDYPQLLTAMQESYQSMPHLVWEKKQIKKLIKIFPEGQVALKVNNEIAGVALSIIVPGKKVDKHHTFNSITGNETFSTHDADGNVLYGIEIFVHPKFRGMKLGRRLYEYRQELCEKLNLKGIAFGGRMPGYHKYSEEMTPKEYIEKVSHKEIHDPVVLSFQMANDFRPTRILRNYLPDDKLSVKNAILMEWDNIYYEGKDKEETMPTSNKTVVRLGLVQWQMRPYKNFEEVMEQAEYFINTLSGYRSDFALFPEYFNAPLMAEFNHLSEAEAIRSLAKYTPQVRERFSELAVNYNINIITGSMPEIVEDELYNIGYLCRRDGSVERYEKLHVTPDEEKAWGLVGGTQLKAFDTDCGKIGILICYDSEFPELSRLLADDGMNILFVPFLTDTQNGYSRVRHCAQARAIENECYVAIAGSVGNLPKVHNMDIQYSQSMVFTPCDFAFPADGVKAAATPNTEMILVVDVNLDLLLELHEQGSVKNLKDRRKDLYILRRKS